MLPYTDQDLRDWPISSNDLADSYRNLAHFVPMSGEPDQLEQPFPFYREKITSLERSEQTGALLSFLDRHKSALNNKGIGFGRARVAVDSTGGPAGCRYCGYCLDGCPYGSIFNPRLHWKRLEREGTKIHKGFYAIEFEEDAEGVTLSTVNVRDGSVRQFRGGRLFAGIGAIATTRLVARSIKVIHRPVRILDSQYFFFPLLSYRKAKDVTVRFTLAEIFLEILNPRISDHYIHFQVYGLSEMFRRAIASMVPSFLRRNTLLSAVEGRFYLVQGFLHSSESAHLELTVSSSRPDADEIHIRGVANPIAAQVSRRVQSLLRGSLAGFGIIPPMSPEMVAPGRSFHAGGSFPMGSGNAPFCSDLLGRPAGLSRTHLLDASTFPSIPASTIAYTSMANSDRIVSETFRHGYLQPK
jgi:ferredoxin